MNFETTKWMREVMKGAGYSIDRIENGTLKSRDQLALVQMLGEMQMTLEKEDTGNTAVTGLIKDLVLMQDKLSSKVDPGETKMLYELSERIGSGLDELDKINYIVAALQLDATSILPLQEQIAQKREELRQMFQEAVNIDLRSGGVSDLTQQAMEAYHFRVDHDRVVAVSESVSHFEKTEKPAVESEKREPAEQTVKKETAYKKVYLSIPRLQPEEIKKLEQELFHQGARYDKWKIEADKSGDGKEHSGKKWFIWKTPNTDLSPFKEYLPSEEAEKPPRVTPDPARYKRNKEGRMQRTWHGKLPEEMSQREQLRFLTETDIELHGTITPSMDKLLKESGYEYVDGDLKEIKPAQKSVESRKYLSIPPQGKKQFAETISYLNENGAKFDRMTRRWYISPECDPDKFKTFLKDSVRTKINQNREKSKDRSSEAETTRSGKILQAEYER